MKKPILAAFMVILSFTGYTQKIRFTDTSNYWGSQGIESSSIAYQGIYQYRLCCTNIFNGLTYYDLHGVLDHWPLDFYVREDTAAGLVYMWNFQDSVEQVLYNYNLHPGDTIHFEYANPPFIDSVLSVDSMLINGVYHKVFSLYELKQ